MPFTRLYRLYRQIKYDYNNLKTKPTYTKYPRSILFHLQNQSIQKGGNSQPIDNGSCGTNITENDIINGNIDGSCGGRSYE